MDGGQGIHASFHNHPLQRCLPACRVAHGPRSSHTLRTRVVHECHRPAPPPLTAPVTRPPKTPAVLRFPAPLHTHLCLPILYTGGAWVSQTCSPATDSTCGQAALTGCTFTSNSALGGGGGAVRLYEVRERNVLI